MFCFYHANCLDGHAAAAVVKKMYPHVKLIPSIYEEPIDINQLRGECVLFVDFSCDRETMIKIAEVAARVQVFDHHKTAEANLNGLPENVEVIFDMNESGASLSYRCLTHIVEGNFIIDAVKDRDLWKFELEHTKEICAGIKQLTPSFGIDILQELIFGYSITKTLLVKIGKEALVAHQNKVKAQAAKASLNDNRFLPYYIVRCDDKDLVSDTGHLILDGGKADVVFLYSEFNGKTTVSIRSTDAVDASAIAENYGGGGHAQAAGFSMGSEVFKRMFL